jgi:hypothetical protein
MYYVLYAWFHCLYILVTTCFKATEDEAAAMITFLKVLDNLSAQEFVVPVDDVDGQTPTGVEETASRNQSPLVGLLRDANICEVVCVGK